MEKLDLFFKNPQPPINKAGIVGTNPDFAGATCQRYSTLYLLRRDVKRCFRPSEPIYWSGTMAVFAGIDLLAKLYSGTDTGTIGTRFQNFVQQHMSTSDVLKMWQLRNSLMHSFGVYSQEPASTPVVELRRGVSDSMQSMCHLGLRIQRYFQRFPRM